MFEASLDGADALSARLEGLPTAVQAALVARSAALVDRLAELVRAKAGGGVLQSRSGALAASVGVDGPTIEGDAVIISVFAGGDLKYAAIQEYGGTTSPHDILPSRGKALAFALGGTTVFARIVHHPGSRVPARSYLRASLVEMAAEIEAELKTAALDAVSQATGA